MKPELLERLLIDRELGELAPEVAALLEEHLAANPEPSARAEEMRELLQRARAASADADQAPSVRLDRARFHRAQQAAWWRAQVGESARLAAVLAIGLGLGWAVGLRSPQFPVAAERIAIADEAAPAASTTFWSIENHLKNARPENAVPSRYRLQWDSPVKMPRLARNP